MLEDIIAAEMRANANDAKAKEPQQVPSVGRTVHYVLSNGEHRAALIVRVFTGMETSGIVNLYVFLDGANDRDVPHGAELAPGILWATSAHYDPAGTVEHTWHWSERV